jgi:hypothetical protein
MKLIRTTVRSLLTLAVISCAAAIAMAQTEKQKPGPTPTPMPRQLMNETPAPPAASPADVASMDSIIAVRPPQSFRSGNQIARGQRAVLYLCTTTNNQMKWI